MKKQVLAAVAVSSLAVSLSAFAAKGPAYSAQSSNNSCMDWSNCWYIGAGINGNAAFTEDFSESEYLHGYNSDKLSYDSNNIGFDVFVGRKINQHFATELGYTWLGNVDYTGKTDGEKDFTAKVEQWNVHANGIGRWPIGEYFNLLVKGGVAWYHNNATFKDHPESFKDTETYDGFALTFGGGLEVMWDMFAIRGEYTAMRPAFHSQEDFLVTDYVGLNFSYYFM